MKKIILVLLLVAGALWYRQSSLANKNTALPAVDQPSQEVSSESSAAEYTFTATADGQTAQVLLETGARVEYQDYGEAGKFVTSLDGLAADEGHYWAFYLNGQYSQTGVSQTILNKGDTITFTYEAIDPTQL